MSAIACLIAGTFGAASLACLSSDFDDAALLFMGLSIIFAFITLALEIVPALMTTL